MKLSQQKIDAPWYSTEPIFGKIDPQPEVQIQPLSRRRNIALIEETTTIKMLPHPDKPGQYLQAEDFNKFRYAEEVLNACVVGVKHFEREDGTPLQATPEDLDYLLETLGIEFEQWLQALVKSVNNQGKKASEKNS